MKLRTALVVISLSAVVTAASIPFVDAQEKTVKVGGAAMYPSRNIVENAAKSKDHTTLVAAVKAAGLVDTLSGPGPFTVFAPTNEAFDKLPKGMVQTLVKPENRATLTKILTYHVVPGKLDASQLSDGQRLTTVEGESLTVKKMGGKVMIVDAKGNASTVTIADVSQSNGVIHVVNSVLMPAS
ncbi:fasciclin domain-containing protein [Bradyrhizobium jicamae]|uniref:fasciclin domain-containing protein n=1 Tax=Bradyrhizobium jicamae TaxID=280332 RepID=UPI001BAB088A|nr:fasciclin domain-containing protein [Bradyrhizobium jicamae]MBR0938973.1 fasciclin domain-containing protein [Bradyrhizobium jicamae]